MDNILLSQDIFKPNEQVCAFFCVEQREKNIHSHDFWEISYVYEGRGNHYTSDDNKTLLKENEFVFLSPGTKHCITSPPKNKGALIRVCNCLITQDYLNRALKKYFMINELDGFSFNNLISQKNPFCLQLSDDSNTVYNTLMMIAHEYNHFTSGSEIIISNAVIHFLIQTARIYEAKQSNKISIHTKNEVMDELIKYIKSNFGSKLSLEFLAEHTHFSREYLSRYFKQYTGQNISDFLTDIRINKAKSLLRSTTHSINDISMYCGYPSISNFQKAFKRLTLLSPSAYRKKYTSKTEN